MSLIAKYEKGKTLSESQGESPDVENIVERLRVLADQCPGSLDVVLRLLQFLEAAREQGKDLAKVRDYFDFVVADPELALMLALLLGSFGEGTTYDDDDDDDDALPGDS